MLEILGFSYVFVVVPTFFYVFPRVLSTRFLITVFFYYRGGPGEVYVCQRSLIYHLVNMSPQSEQHLDEDLIKDVVNI